MGGAAFQKDRVDHRVADQRDEGQQRRQRIDQEDKHQHGNQGQYQRETQRVGRVHGAAGDRAVAGAIHDRIDALIRHVVQDRAGGCRHADAQQAE